MNARQCQFANAPVHLLIWCVLRFVCHLVKLFGLGMLWSFCDSLLCQRPLCLIDGIVEFSAAHRDIGEFRTSRNSLFY